MVPEGRDFDKYSKKSLFAFLGFFYDFQLNFQIYCKNVKTKLDIMFKSLDLQKRAQKELRLANRPLAG